MRYDALEGVGKLTLEGPSMNEDDDVEDRRKRGKTPPDMCAVCSVQDTAEWRRGPAGSRMLCNGCGLCAAKRAKERASEGFGPVSGDVEIWHELRAIGAERFKMTPEKFNLPAGTMERIRATRERTEQTNAASIASKSRKRSGSRSISSHTEREAAASLIGLRRGEPVRCRLLCSTINTAKRPGIISWNSASLGNEWPERQTRSPMALSGFIQALQRPSGPPMTPPSPPLTTRRSSTPHFSPTPMLTTPRASSDYGSRRDSLPPPSRQPMEHRQLQYLPPITQMIPPQYFQGVPPPPPEASSELPNLNRRPSFLEAWRQRTHGAPLPFLTQQIPPISTPSSSVRSTMIDRQPSLEYPERPAHD
ncbi:BQ2448_895 [Microbotryum intermedium]|uniref:BQ2448_895 protein n=1 Tax=Microbotryum intermedium TaxID=269621 RepID=A0A238FA71_9BASI|nr:BQ2448_895 [Microbotryum intermedium]